MSKIKNIVFDLGGVIMNLDVPKTIKALHKIGIEKIVNNTGHNYHHSFFYDFEVGDISEEQFLESLQKLSKKKMTFLEIKEAWNAMILDIPEYRIDFLKDLKEEYNLFLLSNTNSIHQFKYLSEFNQKYNYSFNNLFQRAYYSHEIGLRKPDKKVYEFVLKDSNLKASETLFIDDSLTNIKAAQKTGINSFHIVNYNISDCLDKLKK
ncbi:HAD family hydrolase [Polaribacter septentrionalilitoris]|uniref:HAD family hydrolase n=1 Tax=Polaribacter septentrionalilitoris TaxID=2494657 RepID=UPI001356E827|nr:HAD family phosphatase [Polaribacter septentrionalilitoris]